MNNNSNLPDDINEDDLAYQEQIKRLAEQQMLEEELSDVDEDDIYDPNSIDIEGLGRAGTMDYELDDDDDDDDDDLGNIGEGKDLE